MGGKRLGLFRLGIAYRVGQASRHRLNRFVNLAQSKVRRKAQDKGQQRTRALSAEIRWMAADRMQENHRKS